MAANDDGGNIRVPEIEKEILGVCFIFVFLFFSFSFLFR